MNFEPVRTLADLESLDEADVIEGYTSTRHGDPEPGANRGRSFWHGWRCRMMDYGEIEIDAAHWQLVTEYVNRPKPPSPTTADSADPDYG